jgi:beta-1,4-N-acetylglucosaminyltransferase
MASKRCFVTIGATASFADLITAVLSPSFIDALKSHGYTDLLVQYGQGGKTLCDGAVKKLDTAGIKISGFDLDKSGLARYMAQAKAVNSNSGAQEGVVISHAGKPHPHIPSLPYPL